MGKTKYEFAQDSVVKLTAFHHNSGTQRVVVLFCEVMTNKISTRALDEIIIIHFASTALHFGYTRCRAIGLLTATRLRNQFVFVYRLRKMK